MADPANASAVDSTSRRKRGAPPPALSSQALPRADAKRPRPSAHHDTAEAAKTATAKKRLSASHESIKTHSKAKSTSPWLITDVNAGRDSSEPEGGPSTSSSRHNLHDTTVADNLFLGFPTVAGGKQLQTRRTSRSNPAVHENSCLQVRETTSSCGRRNSKHSVDNNRIVRHSPKQTTSKDNKLNDKDLPGASNSEEPKSPKRLKLKQRFKSLYYKQQQQSLDGKNKDKDSVGGLLAKDGVRYKNSFVKEKDANEKSKAALAFHDSKSLRSRLPSTALQVAPSTSSTDSRSFADQDSSGSSQLNTTDSQSVHKYKLRSQGRLPADRASSIPHEVQQVVRKSSSDHRRKNRELTALGAQTSRQLPSGGPVDQQQLRHESISSGSSRLTRSGAVLRRSTRNKAHSSTTGSCASSSSASGSSSKRAARQHKVGAVAAPVAPLASTASNMTSEQSSAPNTDLPAAEGTSVQDASDTTAAAAALTSPDGPSQRATVDSESDDSEVGRLQALLEARGLPPHLFGALAPRMQHLLHRSMGTNSFSKAQQLLQGLQATGDEGQQLQAVIEMCQVLVMGNEDTLTGFPVKQVVPALISLLQVEHNFDMMNHACRALTYMMEALPRSSAVVVDAVPVFLEKLQVIQCMDVAEQALTALDMLSRRHSKAILQARGVQACLMYLDFFSINAQRNALSITANCCLNLSAEEFQYVSESLTLLANRLTQQDKKSVESVCLAFSRLVDSFQLEPSKLQEIAGTDLLTNLQQLLVVTPPIISTATFITVLRMLSIMCANCPDLALVLLKQNIAETLLYLLTGSVEANHDEVELVPRQPPELYEITALIGELMPKLPSDGIFAVDALLERPSTLCKEQPSWQWQDDRGVWHTYSSADSRAIETAHFSGDDEVSLNTLGRTYTIDFHSMQQINEDTGTSRPVHRKYAPVNNLADSFQSVSSASCDARVACLREERGLAASFIRSLFSVLYEVYSSSAGPSVRCKCLKALLRMVYYASPDLLKEVLKNQVVSSHIAGMMASNDLRIVVGALQMAEILMTKLPEVFGVHFRREGVMHQITQLADPEVPLGVTLPKSANSTSSSFTVSVSNDSQPGPSQGVSNNGSFQTANGSATLTPASTTASGGTSVFTSTTEGGGGGGKVFEVDVHTPSPSVRLSDVLKRKRATKRSSGHSRSKSRHEDLPLSPSLMQDLFTKAASIGNSAASHNSSRQRYSGSGSKAASFLSSLNPVRWGRSMNSSSHDRTFSKDSLNSCLAKSMSNSNLTAGNREKTRVWIREQASKFVDSHSSSEMSGPQHPALNVLSSLTSAIQKLSTADCAAALKDLRDIVMESDISPFEVNHSGLIKALLAYLADTEGPFDRDQRLRIFLHVFAGAPAELKALGQPELNPAWMGALVAKLSGCVSQLEQFPVKVHDLPAGSGTGRGGTSALKFFNTHQLKCNLQRHPECTNLKQWKGGTVKIDPLALVQAIERYLVVRGYGRIRDKDSTVDSDDADSDDDIDDTLAAVVISQSGAKHKLQFLIGGQLLPYNMTVYQAIRQYSCNGNDQSDADTDNETPLGNAGIWVQTHTIYYRPLREDPSTGKVSSGGSSSHSTRKGKGSSSKSASRRKGDDQWNEGVVPVVQSPLMPFLRTSLPESVVIQDACLEVLCLLRILNALNLYWNYLYPALDYKPILPHSDFLNTKVAAKASRQLQDALVIMTGNLPGWLQQVAAVCPFLFPFETRQLLFYVTSFDRDRALQRLLDMSPELTSADSQERVTPRLDRRKRTISRDDILKQAEQVIQDLASSKALLEVQYEDEVGTGLGPTLEFYALVSRELQRVELDLWNLSDSLLSAIEYVHNSTGLFPAVLGKNAKIGHVAKVKNKFRFLGKFMAKAVMDSRMLDLPFSLTFYRWLLHQEHSLTLADLSHVSPDVHKTLRKMQRLVRERNTLMDNANLSINEKHAEVLSDSFNTYIQINQLTLDGCPIEDLGLDFILPGTNVELVKGGKNMHVTIENLHQYVGLVIHWSLVEGVSRQMEAFREGFESVFPLQNLQMFQPEELEAVFCGNPRDMTVGWDTKTLMECCKPDHGYNADSRAIKFLFEVLSSYNRDERRLFIQFLTGTPRLPVGGFKALSPPLTVVRTTLDPSQNPDHILPSVMTCVNYLKLPDYSSIDVLREKLRIAASEGQHSFHLS